MSFSDTYWHDEHGQPYADYDPSTDLYYVNQLAGTPLQHADPWLYEQIDDITVSDPEQQIVYPITPTEEYILLLLQQEPYDQKTKTGWRETYEVDEGGREVLISVRYMKNGEVHRDDDHFSYCNMRFVCFQWHNHDQQHRDDDLPAAISPEHGIWWYQHDKNHRDNGPAMIMFNGADRPELRWYKHGDKHRDNDLPADVNTTIIQWYVDGKRHRQEQPAYINVDGTQIWYEQDQQHRIGAPAVIQADGTQCWHERGKLHRVGAPAITQTDGSELWSLRGELHRLDGPAVVDDGGQRQWWINGQQLTAHEHRLQTDPEYAVRVKQFTTQNNGNYQNLRHQLGKQR